MSEAKKIGLHLLEDGVAEKIVKKVDFDDLDPNLRTYINNKGSAPSGYDDTNLRNRIVDIENKMKASTVEADLAALTTKVNNNANSINNLDKKKIDKTDAENLKKSIVFTDLDQNTRDKIDSAYSYYQTVMPTGAEDITITNAATIAAELNELKKNAVKKSELSSYTKNTDIISNSRLESATKTAIEKLIAGGTGSGSGGSTTTGNYRPIDVPITYDDLDSALVAMIKGANEAAADLNAGIKSESEKIRDAMSTYTIGSMGGLASNINSSNYTYYINTTDVERGKFSDSASGKSKGSSFDMYQQRQIIRNTGGRAMYDPLDERNTVDDNGKFTVNSSTAVTDVYKIMDILAWMYYDTIGDFQLLSNSFQEDVCRNSVDRNTKLSSPSYLGVAYQVFPLMDAVIYLTDRIRNLEAIIKKMCADNNLKTKYFSSHSISTVDDTETPNAKNSSVPSRLKVNNKTS